METIYQAFPIAADCEKVFAAISTPEGIDRWWTAQCAGEPKLGATYRLWFGPEYDWRAVASKLVAPRAFELTMTVADGDWTGSRVGFELAPREPGTWVHFYHAGWPSANEHFRISNHCWAMYLRVLRRNIEHGETVPYETRLSV
jgi:uncharacterized protein YndB with AHSA1/START domain